MPPMTMVFQVKDPARLDKVRPGDNVKFRADKSAGSFVIIDIQVADSGEEFIIRGFLPAG